MEEFLNTIYNYEYFGFYLIMSIIILVVLFLIILFFGKKDQKNREIEATKKLQQINEDAFKEENGEEKLEINSINKESNLEDTIVVTNFDDMPTLNYVEENEDIPEPELPIIERATEEVKDENNGDMFEPLLEKIEEKPLVLDNTNIFSSELVNNEDEVDKEFKKENDEIEVPKFNLESIIKDTEELKMVEKPLNSEPIFSSVYVPQKEESETKTVEIPVKKAMEDLEFELPSLKKEEISEEKSEQIQVPILNDYNLDELSGETYNINK